MSASMGAAHRGSLTSDSIAASSGLICSHIIDFAAAPLTVFLHGIRDLEWLPNHRRLVSRFATLSLGGEIPGESDGGTCKPQRDRHNVPCAHGPAL